jgi:competence protein ComEA
MEVSGVDLGVKVIVDVAGAVEKPGVYQLDEGARLVDALAAAGGLASTADRIWISRYINLAQKLSDGSKIYIPGEDEDQPQIRQEFSTGEGVVRGVAAGVVSINNANLSELDALWGIGEKRGQAIIDGRPYSRLEELTERRVIPKNVFERNLEKLSL